MSNGKLTPKQERFVLNLFNGMSQREAYIQAGYSSKGASATIDHNAYELALNRQIVARYDALQKLAEDESVMSQIERKQRLSEVGRARLTDYVTCGPDRDLIDVGPESPNTGALQEITSRTEYDKDGAGVAVITKIKLHDPIRAIAGLNDMEHIGKRDTGDTFNIITDKVFIDARETLNSTIARLATRIRETEGSSESE